MKNCGKWHRQIFMILGLIICLRQPAAQNERYRPEQFERKERDAYQKPEEADCSDWTADGAEHCRYRWRLWVFYPAVCQSRGSEWWAYCCDLATNLLVYLQERAKEEHLSNLVTVYAAPRPPHASTRQCGIISSL